MGDEPRSAYDAQLGDEDFEEDELKDEDFEKDDSADQKVGNFIRVNRRAFVGLGIVSAIGLFFKGTNEVLKQTDTEIGKALRFMDTYENIRDMQKRLDDAQQDFNADTLAILQDPDGFTKKIEKIAKLTDDLTLEIVRISVDGTKVNSAFVYQKQKKIQAALARFSNENFRLVFKALGIYRGVVSGINTGIEKAQKIERGVSSGIRKLNIPGIPAGSIFANFIDAQASKYLILQSGNITLWGKKIPLGSLAGFAQAAQKLISSLMKLEVVLNEIADPDVEISNNEYINYVVPSPRKEFLDDVYKTGHVLKSRSDNQYSPEEVKTIQWFLVKYGYLIQAGEEDIVNGVYDEDTKAAIKRVIDIFNNRIVFKEKYEKLQEKGVKAPVVDRGRNAHGIQDMLALAGYMGMGDIDKSYGPKTYAADSKMFEAMEIYEKTHEID